MISRDFRRIIQAMNKFYITTAIAYVNAAPHIGFALELCQADALARYNRIQNKDVYFLTGTDEHGTKIEQTAREQGMSPQELADKNSALVKELGTKLEISNNDYVRTTSEIHKRGAQKFWSLIRHKIYEKEYEGLYCVGCESFIPEKDLVDGMCVLHKKAPQKLKEKNYFFKLSEYSEEIKKKILSNEILIKPESRRNEFLSLLEEGLQDVSFSRPKKSLSWGIDVPDDNDQVMYVWCDALTNYISALGFADDDEKVAKYWPANVHLIGKDIIRFHAGIWIGMLMAAELPLPKAIYVHGFVTSEGQKMSKSLGNVVDPFGMLEHWGADPLRYYLLREIPTGDDGDFSKARFETIYKDELANTIGNLVSRVTMMVVKYFDGEHPKSTHAESNELLDKQWKSYHHAMTNFNIKVAIESMLEVARFANFYVEQNKPWELAKTDKERLSEVLGTLLKLCKEVGQMLQPIIPSTAEKILAQVAGDKVVKGEPMFPNKVEK